MQNELLPASDRVVGQTSRKPTGSYDRRHLMDHLKTVAAESTIGEDYVPFIKKAPPKKTQVGPGARAARVHVCTLECIVLCMRVFATAPNHFSNACNSNSFTLVWRLALSVYASTCGHILLGVVASLAY